MKPAVVGFLRRKRNLSKTNSEENYFKGGQMLDLVGKSFVVK